MFKLIETKSFYYNKLSFYNLSIKWEKYQLDLYKLLMSWSVFQANQSILINCQTEKQNKNKGKDLSEYWKIFKNRGILTVNTYDRNLFNRNKCSECSGILLKIGFATCETKLYPWKFYFWTCTKLRILFDLGNPKRHLIYFTC